MADKDAIDRRCGSTGGSLYAVPPYEIQRQPSSSTKTSSLAQALYLNNDSSKVDALIFVTLAEMTTSVPPTPVAPRLRSLVNMPRARVPR